MAGPVDKKLVRWESQERVDVPDVSQVVRSVVDYHESIVGSLFSHAAIISDWKVSKNSGTTIKVERLAGGALISPEMGGSDSIHGESQTAYSVLLDTGSTSKTYDMSTHGANAHHTVWVETKFVASTSDTRVKWSHATDSEYLDTFNTRYELTWAIHVLTSEQPPTYASWVRVGTVFWDGNVLDDSKIYQSGQMLFEGLAHGADPTDGTSGHLASTEAITALAYKTFPLPDFTRSSDRWTYGAKDMGMFCHMVLKKIEELQDSTGLTPWWDKPLNSLNNLFGGGISIGTGQDANKGKYNATPVVVGGETYYDLTSALKSAITFCGMNLSTPNGDESAHIHILPGKYVITSRVMAFLHKNLTITGSGRDSTQIYTMSSSITGAAASIQQGIWINHPSSGSMKCLDMRDIQWISDNANGGGSKSPVTYTLQYINAFGFMAGDPPASTGAASFKFTNVDHHPGSTPDSTLLFVDHDDSIFTGLTTGVNTQWEFSNCSFTHYGGVFLSSATDVRMINCNPIGTCYIGTNDASASASHDTYVSKLHIAGCHEGSIFAAGERKQVFVDGCQLSNLSISAGDETVVRGCNFRHVNGQSKTRTTAGASINAYTRLLIDSYTAVGNPDAHIEIDSCKFQPAGLTSTLSVVSKYSECRISNCFFGTSKGEADATPDTKNIVIGEILDGAAIRTPTSVLGCTFRNSGATIFESVDTIRDCIVHMENSYCQAAFVKNTNLNHAVNGTNHVDRTVLGVTTIKGLDAVFMYDRAPTLFENVVLLEDARIRVARIEYDATPSGTSIWEIRFTDHAPIPYGLGSTGQGDASSSGVPSFLLATDTDINHDNFIQWHWKNVTIDFTTTTAFSPFQLDITNADCAFDILFKDVEMRCDYDHTSHGGSRMRAFEWDITSPDRGRVFFENLKTPMMFGLHVDATNAAKDNKYSLCIKNSYLGGLASKANFYNIEIESTTLDYNCSILRDDPASQSGNWKDGLGMCRIANCRIGLMTGDGVFDERIARSVGNVKGANSNQGLLGDWWPSMNADLDVMPFFNGDMVYRPVVTIGTTNSHIAQGNSLLYTSYESVEFLANYVKTTEIAISAWRDLNLSNNTVRMWPDLGNSSNNASLINNAAVSWKVAASLIQLDGERIRMHNNDIEFRYGAGLLGPYFTEFDYIRLAYSPTECIERPISWFVSGNSVSDSWGVDKNGYLRGANAAGMSATDVRSEGPAIFKFYVHPDHQGPVQYKVDSNIVSADMRQGTGVGTWIQPHAYKQAGMTYAAPSGVTFNNSGTLAYNMAVAHPNAAGILATLTNNIFVRGAPEATVAAGGAGKHFQYTHWEPMATLWSVTETHTGLNKHRAFVGGNLTKTFTITKDT